MADARGEEPVTHAAHANNAPTQTCEDGTLPLKLKLVYGLPRFTIRASFIVIGSYANLFYLGMGAQLQYMVFIHIVPNTSNDQVITSSIVCSGLLHCCRKVIRRCHRPANGLVDR
jgi:hypothetical protein